MPLVSRFHEELKLPIWQVTVARNRYLRRETDAMDDQSPLPPYITNLPPTTPLTTSISGTYQDNRPLTAPEDYASFRRAHRSHFSTHHTTSMIPEDDDLSTYLMSESQNSSCLSKPPFFTSPHTSTMHKGGAKSIHSDMSSSMDLVKMSSSMTRCVAFVFPTHIARDILKYSIIQRGSIHSSHTICQISGIYISPWHLPTRIQNTHTDLQ